MAKGMKTKAVLVGLGIAAGALFGAMAPAHADELSGTGTVASDTTPDLKTVPTGATAFDGIYTVEIYTVEESTIGDNGDPDLVVGNVGLHLAHLTDPTLAVGSYTFDAATAKGL